jgi:hypothetical protein
MIESDSAHVILPYCVHFLDQRTLVILNRQYKPIGMTTRDWVEYEPHAFKIGRKLTHRQIEAIVGGNQAKDPKRMAKDLAIYDAGQEVQFWLFYDGNAPWRGAKSWAEYAGRLERLGAIGTTRQRR